MAKTKSPVSKEKTEPVKDHLKSTATRTTNRLIDLSADTIVEKAPGFIMSIWNKYQENRKSKSKPKVDPYQQGMQDMRMLFIEAMKKAGLMNYEMGNILMVLEHMDDDQYLEWIDNGRRHFYRIANNILSDENNLAYQPVKDYVECRINRFELEEQLNSAIEKAKSERKRIPYEYHTLLELIRGIKH